MRIFFIRHGKAEERSLNLQDATRALTKQGIDILKTDLPYLADYLSSFTSLAVWTSPLLRAKQTAEILVEKLQNTQLQTEDFLASGNTDVFKQKLSDLNEDCLVLVGHNPFFDEWVSTLSSENIEIKKGETVLVELFDKQNWKAKIIARLKPKDYVCELNRIILSDFFKTKYEEIIQQKDLFLSKVDKPKTVHNFRISIRRYRSLLSLFEPLFLPDAFVLLDKKLRALLKNLFYLRELDVLIKQYACYLGKKENSILLSKLKDLRKEESLRVNELVSAENYDAVLSSIFTDTNNALSHSELKGVCLDDYIWQRIEALFLTIKTTEKTLNIKRIKDLHRYRICWKKLRYALEVTNLDAKNKKYTTAKMSQDLLGDICDVDVNIQLMKKIFICNTDNELQKEKDFFIKKEKERMKKLRKEFVKGWG